MRNRYVWDFGTLKSTTLVRISLIKFSLLFTFLILTASLAAQQVTGVWQGKIDRKKVEVKIILKGDSLTGTSYYFESPTQYRRYSIKGYFDPTTNEAVWWDDQLIEEQTGRSANAAGKMALLSRADFNCPDGRTLKLDGKTEARSNGNPRGDVHLVKNNVPQFDDEWNDVIDNYLVGGNDPEYISSIEAIATNRQPAPAPPVQAAPSRDMVRIPPMPVEEKIDIIEERKEIPVAIKPLTIDEKFAGRKKELALEIPLQGDSIELRFYDNAEIDGDSISLFLNDKLIFSHIRLLGSAYTIRLPIAELLHSNELVMVAENLGSIPPNTSYMVAIVGEQRYEARLESTEGSSAMIRLVKNE